MIDLDKARALNKLSDRDIIVITGTPDWVLPLIRAIADGRAIELRACAEAMWDRWDAEDICTDFSFGKDGYRIASEFQPGQLVMVRDDGRWCVKEYVRDGSSDARPFVATDIGRDVDEDDLYPFQWKQCKPIDDKLKDSIQSSLDIS